MTIVNLDENFMPCGPGIELTKLDFPSGCEPHIKLSLVEDRKATITCRINTANDLLRLMLTCDALRRMHVKEIFLVLPYLPFARQDRVMVPGEPLSIQIIADLHPVKV